MPNSMLNNWKYNSVKAFELNPLKNLIIDKTDQNLSQPG